MKIQYLQHVPFEDIAYVGNWADKNGVHLGRTRLYEDDPYPFLIVETRLYPLLLFKLPIKSVRAIIKLKA